jgi:fatty-acyl-CoA synthase
VVCGRIKDMIVVGGRNLYPEDYEQCAVGVEGVRRGNVIAFGIPEQERMVVVAETRAQDGAGAAVATETMRLLTRRLSHAPQEVMLVPPGTLPKTSSGKVQRGVCRQRYLAGDLPAIATVGR